MATLNRDIRCSWNPTLFHNPPHNNLAAFDINIKMELFGYNGWTWVRLPSIPTMRFPSSIGDQSGGVLLGVHEVQADEPFGGIVSLRIWVHDPPVTNLSPPPSECDVYYGNSGSGAGGYNEHDWFSFDPMQELVDNCSLEKWHIPKPV